MYLIDKAREIASDVDATLRDYFHSADLPRKMYYVTIAKAVLFLIAATLFFSGAAEAAQFTFFVYVGVSLAFYAMWYKLRRG
jgi:hypothetical protein